MQAAGREPDQHVALPHPCGPEQIGLVDRRPRRTPPGRTGRRASRRGARRSRRPAARIRPGGSPRRRPPRARRPARARPCPRRGSRGRTAARRRCTRRRRRTSPPGRCPRCRAGRLARAISSLVPTPSVAAASRRPSPIRNRPAKPPTLVGHLGAASPRGEVADQRHGLRRGLDVDAGVAVGVAHAARAHAVGSWSWSSSTNLPALLGDGDRVLAVEAGARRSLGAGAAGGRHHALLSER